MPEENLQSEQTQNLEGGTTSSESNGNENYIKALQDLKQNTVSKEDYLKLKDENKKLVDALVSGQQLDLPQEETIDQEALRKELYSEECNLTNREYWEKTMKLRKAIIDEGKPDPFLPNGINVSPTQLDFDAANQLADWVDYCLQETKDTPEVFTSLFLSKFKDVTNLPPQIAKFKR